MKKISLFLISIFCICLISACSSKEDSIEIQNTQINDFSEKNTENKSIDDKISYMDVINKDLHLMDITSITMCMENSIPIIAFGLNSEKGLVRAAMGEKVGTIIA